jgi:hypothetical protein
MLIARLTASKFGHADTAITSTSFGTILVLRALHPNATLERSHRLGRTLISLALLVLATDRSSYITGGTEGIRRVCHESLQPIKIARILGGAYHAVGLKAGHVERTENVLSVKSNVSDATVVVRQ